MLKPRFTITNRITAGLTQIERARGFLEAANLSEEWLSNMRSRALLLEAHHTTHIEGTKLTLEKPALRIEDYEKLCPEAGKRTLQRDIKSLIDKGVLRAEGSARSARYILKIKGL